MFGEIEAKTHNIIDFSKARTKYHLDFTWIHFIMSGIYQYYVNMYSNTFEYVVTYWGALLANFPTSFYNKYIMYYVYSHRQKFFRIKSPLSEMWDAYVWWWYDVASCLLSQPSLQRDKIGENFYFHITVGWNLKVRKSAKNKMLEPNAEKKKIC